MKTGTELRREALREVEGCVCKDRQNSYGDAESNFAVIAQGDMSLLREVQSVLKGRGLSSHMIQPPGGCGSK